MRQLFEISHGKVQIAKLVVYCNIGRNNKQSSRRILVYQLQIPFHTSGIQVGGGFVQKHQLAVAYQRQTKLKPLLHAAGKMLDRFVYSLRQCHAVNGLHRCKAIAERLEAMLKSDRFKQRKFLNKFNIGR